jgi:hypothetical protein
VAAGHDGESAVFGARIAERVRQDYEPVHHLAVLEAVVLRRVPRRAAAVQAELFAARTHQQRVAVVVAKFRADKRSEIRQHAGVREQPPERLVPRVRRAEHREVRVVEQRLLAAGLALAP